MRLPGRRAPAFVPMVLCLVFLLSVLPTHHAGATESSVPTVPTKACSCPPLASTAAGTPGLQGRGPFSANYDEQLGTTFTQSFTSIEYNVTAVQQDDSILGDGPASLVNGLSNSGYWYQVGFSWNWAPGSNPGTGFDMNYEVFDSLGNSIFPAGNQGGVSSFSGPVKAGDLILLDLYFSSNNQTVEMVAKDTDTGAAAAQSYPSMGGSYFVGLPNQVANSNGFFTGLMTEWYHGAPYYANEAPVVYSASSALTSAWMWMDEFDANSLTSVFSSNTSAPVSFADPIKLEGFSYNGTTEYSDAFEFATGALTNETNPNGNPLVLYYSVSGGTGYAAPTLTYVSNKTAVTVPLEQSPTAYYADPGTTWSVSPTLGGSTSQHRWQTAQTVSGTANASVVVKFTYYDQYDVTFGFTVDGGGSGYSAPTVGYSSFGATAKTPVGTAVWADAGSDYQFLSPLPGSNSTERWDAMSASPIDASGQVSVVYYREYLVTFDLKFRDTEILPALSLTSTAAGQSYSATVVSGANPEWLDSGASYAVTRSYSLEGGQRLLTNGTGSGTVNGSATVELVYQHQFYVEVNSSAPGGGTVSPSSGWYDSGTTLDLVASPASGWASEGWQGTGSDSVSATTSSAILTVGPGTPANETAVFYPGISVRSDGPSSVSYSDGAASGTVGGGAMKVVYVPPSTTLTLTGSSIPFVTQFGGWRGATNTSAPSVSLVVAGPTSLTADSAYDYLGISGFALLVAMAIVASVWLSRRQLGRRVPAVSGDVPGS